MSLAERVRVAKRRLRDDEGFTLVELLVYSILMIVVLGIAGALFIQMLVAQRDTIAMANATNESQVAFKRLEYDVRNADWVQVKDGGNLLIASTRVATTGNTTAQFCVGYYYDSTTLTLHRIQTALSAPTANALAAVGTSALPGLGRAWPVAVTDAGKVGTTPMFGPFDGLFNDPAHVDVSIRSNTIDNRKPIEFTTSITIRPQAGLGAACQ